MGPGEWQTVGAPAELASRYRTAGWWDDDTLGQLLHRDLARSAGRTFAVHSRTRPWSGTLGDVHLAARRLAAGLRARGIGAGDVVAFQLPNCVEAAITFYAAAFLGAVVVPIVHFYGPKEVGYVLRRTGVRAFVTIDSFGPIDYLANLDRLGADLDGVELVAVVGLDAPSGGRLPFESLLADAPLTEPAAVDPDAPALVGYTSGTTADPKGVIHSHRTIGAEVRQLGALQPPGARDNLVGAPVGHAIGMLSALLTPPLRGRPVHLVDAWEPGHVLELMAELGLASGSGATYFLTSLLDHPSFTAEHLALMSHTGLGGSAVPLAVSQRATDLGISVVRMYGATEHPSITGGTHDDPLHQRIATDGRPLAGVEVRLVDEAGHEVGPGEPGEILSRGPDRFVGYTDASLNAAAIDADGWYRTGDVGIVDDGGALRITDRVKDVIIRGGENVSAAEVEEALMRVPGVLEAAVVSGPDERLGERVVAFVRAGSDTAEPDLDTVRAAMREVGLARQKWPEELHLVDALPRTPSGKVQKVVLRDRLRSRR